MLIRERKAFWRIAAATLGTLTCANVLLPQVGSPNQATRHGTSRHLILSVDATHLAPNDTYSYIYIRVFSDGTAEWETANPGHRESLGPQQSKLSDDDLSQLESILNDPKIMTLGDNYETRFAIVDSWTEWKVALWHEGQLKNIKLVEFSPGIAQAMKHPYPKLLVRLGCTSLRLRQKISREPVHPDSGCVVT